MAKKAGKTSKVVTEGARTSQRLFREKMENDLRELTDVDEIKAAQNYLKAWDMVLMASDVVNDGSDHPNNMSAHLCLETALAIMSAPVSERQEMVDQVFEILRARIMKKVQAYG